MTVVACAKETMAVGVDAAMGRDYEAVRLAARQNFQSRVLLFARQSTTPTGDGRYRNPRRRQVGRELSAIRACHFRGMTPVPALSG